MSLKYQIKLDKDLTLTQLQNEVAKGGRFIVFSYCISILFALTYQRLSPAIFISYDDSISNHKSKYNILSYIFGWWQIPWGLISSIRCIKNNNKGGLDVTEDIMLNITEESLKNREINYEITHLLFEEPGKSEIKAFHKAIFRKLDPDITVSKIIVGLCINVEEDSGPSYVVGIMTLNNFEIALPIIEKSLYTQFYKHVHFEFIDLRKDNEIYPLLEKQGVIITDSI